MKHTREDDGNVGVDLHDDIGTTLTPVFTENGTYSTYLFAERAVDIINNHNVDEVCTETYFNITVCLTLGSKV